MKKEDLKLAMYERVSSETGTSVAEVKALYESLPLENLIRTMGTAVKVCSELAACASKIGAIIREENERYDSLHGQKQCSVDGG